MRFRGRPLLVAVLASAAAAAALSVVALRRDDASPRLEVGDVAPPLTGTAVRGGQVSLDRLRGHVVLLSFLNSRGETTTEGDPSRAQVVFLRSMLRQHARFGLRVVVVDASELAGAGRPSRSDLVNSTYDLDLDPTVALLPDDGSLARRFAVEHVPTTFLVGRRGVVRDRWNGFVPAARLDFAIRRLEGRGAPG